MRYFPLFLPPGLLYEAQFRRYWTASTISVFGDGVSSLAVPLAAASILHADPLEMGYLTALAWLPSLLFSVHAGILVDRRGRHINTMIAADVARFLLLGSVPVAYVIGFLSLSQLFIVTFAAGIFSVFFNVCNSAVFGLLVSPEKYVEAQALLTGGQQVATLGGPSLAGFIVQSITAPFAIAIDAASFLFSAVLLAHIKHLGPSAEQTVTTGKLTGGMQFIKKNPIIRSILLAIATVNFFTSVTQGLFIIYMTRDLHAPPVALGFFFGSSALGGVIGSSFATRASRRVGVGRALLVGCILYCVPDIIIPLAHGSVVLVCVWLIPQALVTGVGVALQNISIGAIFTEIVPPLKRATVRGSFQAVSFGMRPVGAVLGGILGDQLGIRPALWVGALGAALSFLWILFSPASDFRMPLGRANQPASRGASPSVALAV